LRNGPQAVSQLIYRSAIIKIFFDFFGG